MKALAVKIVRGRFHIEKWERHSYDLPLEVELFLREVGVFPSGLFPVPPNSDIFLLGIG